MRRPPLLALVLTAGLAATALVAGPPGSLAAAPATPAGSTAAAHGAPSTNAPGVVARERRPVTPQLRRKGRWLVDGQGRVVLVHGLNLVFKHAPYVPPATRAGFTARDARWMKRHGFNAARVGTLWAGITPDEPGVADASYLRKWQRVLDLLANRGIWIQFDFHQDQWHETYGGEGVPNWAMERPLPFSLTPYLDVPFPLGYWTPEVSTVFDRFWKNHDGVLDGWVEAWEIAARRWKEQPYSMGYDLLNEPWSGLEWASCLTAGCRSTYVKELQPSFTKALRAIRRIDPDNIVWWEPQQFAGGQLIETFFTAVKGERNLGLSWHNYCQDVFLESMGLPLGNVENCWKFARNRNQHALDQARRMRAVPMMSEWGATDNVRAIEIDAAVADEHLMGWTHWAYKYWNDPTTADTDQGLFTDDADLTSVKQEKLRRLVRTYAQATAGTPLRMRFDVETGAFDYRYRPDRRISAPTRIFVSPLHYPDGWRVKVRNGRVTKRTGRHVHVVPKDPSKPVRVRIAGTA